MNWQRERAAMHRTKVESSNILSVGYDRATKTLEVEYAHGGIYQYADTKADEYAALIAAKSKGRYLQQHFVKAGRAYQKLEPEGEGLSDEQCP